MRSSVGPRTSLSSAPRVARYAALAVLAACSSAPTDYSIPQPDPDVDAAVATTDGGPADGAIGRDAATAGGVDLSLAMTAAPTPVAASSTLTYHLDVVNHASIVARNVKVVHTLPAGNISFQSASGEGWMCQASGQIVTCGRDTAIEGAAPTITVAITTPPTGGSLSSSATVTNDIGDPEQSNNDAAIVTDVVASSDLSLSLSAPSAAAARASLSYTIDVNNLGPRDATNLTVTNRLPDGNVQFVSASGIGWTCALAGQLVTCTRPLLIVGAAPSIAIQITTPDVHGALTDQVSVTSATADLNTANNTASATTSVFDSADLSITATDTPDPVRIGASLTYALAIANAGPTAATAVSVVDQLPSGTAFVSASGAGWTCGFTSVVTCTRAELAANASAPTISIVVTAPVSPRTITNTAEVSSATSDPDASNNRVATDTLANLFADLSVTLIDSPDPVQGTTSQGCTANDCVTYTIDVSNAGPDAATALRVTVALPPNGTFFNAVGSAWVCPAPQNGTLPCTRNSLAIGAAPSIFLTWKAPSPGGFSIVATTAVTAGSTDPDPSNNAATEDTTVRP